MGPGFARRRPDPVRLRDHRDRHFRHAVPHESERRRRRHLGHHRLPVRAAHRALRDRAARRAPLGAPAPWHGASRHGRARRLRARAAPRRPRAPDRPGRSLGRARHGRAGARHRHRQTGARPLAGALGHRHAADRLPRRDGADRAALAAPAGVPEASSARRRPGRCRSPRPSSAPTSRSSSGSPA